MSTNAHAEIDDLSSNFYPIKTTVESIPNIYTEPEAADHEKVTTVNASGNYELATGSANCDTQLSDGTQMTQAVGAQQDASAWVGRMEDAKTHKSLHGIYYEARAIERFYM